MQSTIKFFVIMPSGKHGEYQHGTEEADYIYREIICKAIYLAWQEHPLASSIEDLSIEREIDELSPGAINKSIVRKTAQADYVIVDITGSNPNVFFELGLRYTFKPYGTILVRQKDSYIPFDITSYRCIEYNSKFFGVQEAINQIKETLISIIEKRQIDSLVYDTFPHMAINLFDKTQLPGVHDENIMPWNYFWGKFISYLEILKKSKYQPDYIIGISNGGMFLADTVSRLLYTKTPIISLWANRKHTTKDYFNNPVNEALIKVVSGNKKESIELLIFDDIVSTGITWVKMKEFFKENLSNYSITFIPLFSRNARHLETVIGDTIWEKEIFKDFLPEGVNFEEFCHTDYAHLPYEKEINYSSK